MWSYWSHLISLLLPFLKIGNSSTCPPGLFYNIMIKWYLRDTKVLRKLQGALKKCLCVCVCVYRKSFISLLLNFFLGKIRLFKSHYAQLSCVLPKPLYSITSSKSEKGGESGCCGRWGLLFSQVPFSLWDSNTGVLISHEASYLFQLYQMKHDFGPPRYDHFQILWWLHWSTYC